MNMQTSNWIEEMNNMLAKFESQAIYSLRIMRMSLNRNGSSMPSNFKEIFLRTSTNRLLETYDKFEFDCLLEDGNSYTEIRNDDVDLFTNTPARGLDSFDRFYPCTDFAGRQGLSSTVTSGVNNFVIGSTTIKRQNPTENNLIEIIDDDPDQNMSNVQNYGENLDQIKSSANKRRTFAEALLPPVNDINAQKDRNRVGTHNSKPSVAGSNTRKRTGETINVNPKKVKRFQCQICEYSSDYSGNLQIHVRTHTGEKPYRCDRCLKRFTQQAHLNVHMKTHTTEFAFHCFKCFRGFSTEIEKDEHENGCNHRLYECYICKKFSNRNKSNMKIHMRNHTDEKPFRCDICEKRYKIKESLILHLNTIHR